MNLYFAPLACSLATRIAFYEAGLEIDYTYVDLKKKQLTDGSDYLRINPMGQVLALRTDEGTLLTENTAVLQYVSDNFLAATDMAPASSLGRYQLQQWLGFIATELQKTIFIPLLDAQAPEGAKSYARDKAELRFNVLQEHLWSRQYLLDRFTVADAYLVTVLNWAPACGIDLDRWLTVRDYHQRLLKRPSIARAFGEEWQLYKQEQTRRAAN